MLPVSDARLALGQRIELRGADSQWLASRVEDMDATSVTVAWPTGPSLRLLTLSAGDTLEIAAFAPNGVHSTSATVKHTSKDGVPLVTLAVMSEWQRMPRRNAVRIGVAIRPRVAAKLYGDAYRDIRLGIINISATGIQVRSQDELSPGDRLEVAFELMDVDGELEVEARVCRVQRLERVWDAGCEFEALPDRLSRKIVQFIFAQQRALSRSRRG